MLDNAGGGRRGLRAEPSAALLEALQSHYRIDARNAMTDLGGSSSLNLRVNDGHKPYVVRVHRPYVTEARLGAIHHVRSQLALHGIPCSTVISTADGQSCIRLDDRLIEVEAYVEHDSSMDSWARLKTGLPLLGTIHTILRHIELDDAAQKPLFANHIEPAEALAKTLKGIQRIRAWNPSAEDEQLAKDSEALAQLVYSAEQAFAGQLPRQLVHGDFWDNNVLFRDGQIVLVADFDFMGERARIDDLALTLYFALLSLTSIKDGISEAVMGELRTLVEAYEQGLGERLTKEERAALPLAIARQPLWSVGGWIALLDDEGSARQHASATGGEVAFMLRSMRAVERWQNAFV